MPFILVPLPCCLHNPRTLRQVEASEQENPIVIDESAPVMHWQPAVAAAAAAQTDAAGEG